MRNDLERKSEQGRDRQTDRQRQGHTERERQRERERERGTRTERQREEVRGIKTNQTSMTLDGYVYICTLVILSKLSVTIK